MSINSSIPNPRTALQSYVINHNLHDTVINYYIGDKAYMKDHYMPSTEDIDSTYSIIYRYWIDKIKDIKRTKEIWNEHSS